jgi:hypothetical protein
MVAVALWVRLETKPGREHDLAALPYAAATLARTEPVDVLAARPV